MVTPDERIAGLQAEVRGLQGKLRRVDLGIFLVLALVTVLGPATRLGDPDPPGRTVPLSFLATAGRLLKADAEDFGTQGFAGPMLLIARAGALISIVALVAALVLCWTILARPTSSSTAFAVTGTGVVLIVGCVLTAVGTWLLPDPGDDTLTPAYALLSGISAGVWLLVDARE